MSLGAGPDRVHERPRQQSTCAAAQRVKLEEAAFFSVERAPDLVALDDALNALAQIDERKSRVVELRFFGGLSMAETAEVLKVSTDTILRDWRLAKSWLLRELGQEESSEE
jgi:RNA polymerase sigma-70 factor, ECF subfamily